MTNQINLSPITQFAQQVRSAEFAHQKEVKMSIQQARLLNLALIEIMDALLSNKNTKLSTSDNEVIRINMDGGGFN